MSASASMSAASASARMSAAAIITAIAIGTTIIATATAGRALSLSPFEGRGNCRRAASGLNSGLTKCQVDQMADDPLPSVLSLTPLNPQFNENPHALLDRLRNECPVHR